MKASSSQNPIVLSLLSLSSLVLLAGLVVTRWPFEIPGIVVGHLWLSNVLDPLVRGLFSASMSISRAPAVAVSWWRFAMGIALLLAVLGGVGKSDRPLRRWGILIGLALCLSGLGIVEALRTRSLSMPTLEYLLSILRLALGLGVGVFLAGIGLGVVENGSIPLSRRLARAIRLLLFSAAVGIGSFVLLPIGLIAFALALAAISLAYARATLGSLRPNRLSSAIRQDPMAG